jgi:hypothetical protein
MRTLALLSAALLSIPLLALAQDKADEKGFVSLFDGKSLAGWKVNESPESVKVEDGKIVTNGKRAHLFYDGDVAKHDFKNFQLKLDVMTKANSNAGVYFHTEFQKDGWPQKGFECQVNNSYKSDPRKTGSLYAVKDVKDDIVKDDEWFEYDITVQGKKVELRVNGKLVNEWTQPDDYENKGQPARKIDRGTFALQAHDPGSTVYFKNIRVKPLAD